MNKKKKKMIDYGRYGYFFIAPFFITYLVFQLWPLINTFYYSTLTLSLIHIWPQQQSATAGHR